MATKTFTQLTAVTTLAAGDELVQWNASAGAARKITVTNFIANSPNGGLAEKGAANTFTAAQTVNANFMAGAFFVDYANLRVGIGTTSATKKFVIDDDPVTRNGIEFDPQPTGVTLLGWSRGTSGYIPIIFEANRFDFLVGNILVGTAVNGGKVAVDQSSGTGAIPVLYLDQGDVDQDFIEFVGVSSTGNATSISTDAEGAYAGRMQITVNGTRRWIGFTADA